MLSFFAPKPPVDHDEFEWLVACFAWVDRSIGPSSADGKACLILPSPEFFPVNADRGHELAEELFSRVKHYCGITDWPCQLVMGGQKRANVVAPGFTGETRSSSALGLFLVGEGGATIVYDPALLDSPQQLIATLAHEVAHYLLHGKGTPPGGEELEEHATDCLAAYLGFGVFQANCAKQFEQFANAEFSGWEMKTAGYLSEQALVTLTALFVRRFGCDPVAAELGLKSYLKVPFRKALKAIDHRFPNLPTQLEALDITSWN